MNSNKEEIDLDSLFKGLERVRNKFLSTCYHAIQFLIKSWYIFLILIILGGVLGYFSQKYGETNQEATVVIRTNFNSEQYTYNAIDVIAKKAKSKDTLFFKTNGLRADSLEIKNIEITPIFSFKDLTEEFKENGRDIDALLRNLNFQDIVEEKIEPFRSSFKYHTLTLTLSSVADEKSVESVLNYLNNQEVIKRLGEVGKKGIEEQIKVNSETLAQIDTVISTYSKGESLPSSSSQIFVVDKNFNISNILELKMELQKNNKELSEDLVFADKPIISIDSNIAVVDEKGILTNKVIFYPMLFVFLFLVFAVSRHLYRYIKTIAMKQ
ncbi:hypothetical protein [Aequorivita sp. Q41]|uniref:hypothetical protein n=1 Tax=Aequorivita sp. Q41 TaxID=3153300 RepID=UPI003241C01A